MRLVLLPHFLEYTACALLVGQRTVQRLAGIVPQWSLSIAQHKYN